MKLTAKQQMALDEIERYGRLEWVTNVFNPNSGWFENPKMNGGQYKDRTIQSLVEKGLVKERAGGTEVVLA